MLHIDFPLHESFTLIFILLKLVYLFIFFWSWFFYGTFCLLIFARGTFWVLTFDLETCYILLFHRKTVFFLGTFCVLIFVSETCYIWIFLVVKLVHLIFSFVDFILFIELVAYLFFSVELGWFLFFLRMVDYCFPLH